MLKKVLFSTFFIASPLYGDSNQFDNSSSHCPNLSTSSLSSIQTDTVRWVVDGDTIHTAGGKKLRLLHINAPEVNPKTSLPAEPYAKQSKQMLSSIFPKGSRIHWTTDDKQYDSYSRVLAFIFDNKGSFINQKILQSGMAQLLVIPPNQQYWRCLKDAELAAIKNTRGIWHSPLQIEASIENLTDKKGYHSFTGSITSIVNSRKYRWAILNNALWVGIKRKDFRFFEKKELDFVVGDRLSLRGYVYFSHGEYRVNLRHPAMYL
ncbi:MAG: thermonuclease family protein [Kangiellaceae bacterium]|nr:thermonuclease family protein [Kangiellaceae bacterium]